MENRKSLDGTNTDNTEASRKSLYKIGGAVALVAVLLYVVDVILTFGGEPIRYGSQTAVDWLGRLQSNLFLGLRDLGLFNVISLTVGIPLYLALYATHRRAHKVYAGLALILYLAGTAIYASVNAAILMFALSGKYMAATTDAQRTLLAAAGEAILAGAKTLRPVFS